MKSREPRVGLSEDIFMKANDYDFLVPYAGNWVIVYDNKVVAAAETLHDVIMKVSPEISKETSILFKVPTNPERLLVVLLR